MAKFEITYGVGGGYNDSNTEIVECNDLDEAWEWAYEAACQSFESFGVFDYDEYEEVAEEEGWDDNDWDAAYLEEIERWCHYKAKEVK